MCHVNRVSIGRIVDDGKRTDCRFYQDIIFLILWNEQLPCLVMIKNLQTSSERRLLAGVFWYNKKIEEKSRMKINVQKELDTHLLTISYIVPAGLAETWNLLATDSGFVRWFPQLRVEGDKLVFEMEGF